MVEEVEFNDAVLQEPLLVVASKVTVRVEVVFVFVAVGKVIAEQVIAGLKGEIVSTAVNLPSVDSEELKTIKPYVELSEKLGKFYYQMNKEKIYLKKGSRLATASWKSASSSAPFLPRMVTWLSVRKRQGLSFPSEVTRSRLQNAQNSVLCSGRTTSTSAPSRQYFFRWCILRVRTCSDRAARLSSTPFRSP